MCQVRGLANAAVWPLPPPPAQPHTLSLPPHATSYNLCGVSKPERAARFSPKAADNACPVHVIQAKLMAGGGGDGDGVGVVGDTGGGVGGRGGLRSRALSLPLEYPVSGFSSHALCAQQHPTLCELCIVPRRRARVHPPCYPRPRPTPPDIQWRHMRESFSLLACVAVGFVGAARACRALAPRWEIALRGVLSLGFFAVVHGGACIQVDRVRVAFLGPPPPRIDCACVCVAGTTLHSIPARACKAGLVDGVGGWGGAGWGWVRGGVVWCGVVWCGVVRCSVVWCGVVWCGVV
jgi:hypothetical protein